MCAPVAWRGSEKMGVSAQNNKIHLAIATWEWPSYFDPAQRLKGIRLDLADYRRPDPATAPCLAKAAGLYMICTISKHKAERKGYADAMMLDWQGRVAECTGANIFFIKDGKIHTPIADCFLDGITRAHRDRRSPSRRGIEVIERRIMPDELSSFSECFITGTRGRGDGGVRDRAVAFTPGAITKQLMDDYTAEVQPKGKAAAACGCKLQRRLRQRALLSASATSAMAAFVRDHRLRIPISGHTSAAARRSAPRSCASRRAPSPSDPTLCAVTRAPSSTGSVRRPAVPARSSPAAAQSAISLARSATLHSSITRRAG